MRSVPDAEISGYPKESQGRESKNLVAAIVVAGRNALPRELWVLGLQPVSYFLDQWSPNLTLPQSPTMLSVQSSAPRSSDM